MILNEIESFSQKFNAQLDRFFPKPEGAEKRVVEAMEYSVKAGGKRIRPFLVYNTAKMFGLGFDDVIDAAVSLEMLHTYSLIHDDLPAMDNDDFRRGKPTCHKQFDEATAIIAGDGLLTKAFEVIADANLTNEKKCKLVKLLANAAGAYDGMVAGQMLDLYAEKNPQKDENLISRIEKMKTGRLLKYAIVAGAVLADANEDQLKALEKYATNIGMTFQISDDILDYQGDAELVGKTLRKDKEQGKITFVTLYGLEKAKQMEQDLTKQAKEALDVFGNKADVLKDLADFIIQRNM